MRPSAATIVLRGFHPFLVQLYIPTFAVSVAWIAFTISALVEIGISTSFANCFLTSSDLQVGGAMPSFLMLTISVLIWR